MTENWYPVPRSKNYSNVGCDFPARKQDNRVFFLFASLQKRCFLSVNPGLHPEN